MTISPTPLTEAALDRSDAYAELDKAVETMCLFQYRATDPAARNVIAVFDPDHSGAFSGSGGSISALLTPSSLRFLWDALKNDENAHILLLTKKNRPIVVLSHIRHYLGLCLAVEMKASPEATLAFLKSMPSIRYAIDPAFSEFSPNSFSDPTAFARLGLTFRRLFSLFDVGASDRLECKDVFSTFRLLRAKLESASRAFGIEGDYLIQRTFDAPLRKGITLDTPLFSAAILLTLFTVCEYAVERHVHAIMLTVDQCPAVCVHFEAYSDAFCGSLPMQILQKLYETKGCYFHLSTGEAARTEANKIPGIRRIVNGELYPKSEHVLAVLSPVRRVWTEYVLRSPIFRLPTDFYKDIP